VATGNKVSGLCPVIFDLPLTPLQKQHAKEMNQFVETAFANGRP
jgi:hypothetical protein